MDTLTRFRDRIEEVGATDLVVGVIGDSPVLIEQAGKHAGVPDGATTFWRLNPRAASAST